MSFDFVGIFPDESTEDVGTIQVPSSWRKLFEEPDTVELFWTLYMTLPHDWGQTTAMQVLVMLSSIRRSLFTGDEERRKVCTFLFFRFSKSLDYSRTEGNSI